jgi:hypothetical protein
MSRDHSQRFRDIEKAALELIAFHDTYVAKVQDNTGHELGGTGSGEWTDMIESLRVSVRSIPREG